MYQIRVALEGVADILFNRMTDEEMSNFRGGKSAGDMSDEQRQKLAEKKVYADADGLYWPPWSLKKAILEGANAAGLKFNRKPLRARLAATLFIPEFPRFVTDAGKAVAERDYLHMVPGRQPPGPKGKMAIVRRPALRAGWRIRAELTLIDDTVPTEAVRQAVESAGLLVGVGGWRPEYGRFVVREWQAVSGDGQPATEHGEARQRNGATRTKRSRAKRGQAVKSNDAAGAKQSRAERGKAKQWFNQSQA